MTRIQFNRLEWAGAFGDIGTDLPLIVGIILASGLDPAGALITFGLMQVATGVVYRMPMPVQPLKAMAAIVIAQKVTAPVLLGGGLAIGVLMLVAASAGLLDWVGRLVPKAVIRGIQFGLGLQLGLLACKEYIPAAGPSGFVLAAVGMTIVLALGSHRRYPSALVVIALGVAYAAATGLDLSLIQAGFGLSWPVVHAPAASDIGAGLLLLALPQIPLSLGNSILATKQVAADLFPDRPITLRRVGLTYAAMNLVSPFLGGIPSCHGSGGMAGHYAFGGRTGGSVVIYGSMYLVAGLFFAGAFAEAIRVFPLPVLGVLLLGEAVALLRLIADVDRAGAELPIALLVGLTAVGLPYGYLVGLVAGTAVAALAARGHIRWFDDLGA